MGLHRPLSWAPWHIETYLATVGHDEDDLASNVPFHVQNALREYLRCGTLAHGLARAYCSACGHDVLIAFSCKGRDICPSCATRRMVESAAHLTDQVLPRVPYRQWVLSVPKRVRWHLREKPEALSGVLRVFLRAVETTLRRRSPGAPPGARFGAVAFVLGLPDTEDTGVRPLSADDDVPRSAAGRLAARCWALLLARIYECLPLLCPRCGDPMRIIALILDPPVIERILTHIGEPATPPAVLPARAPPQAELGFEPADRPAAQTAWPEIDQTGGQDSWD